MLSFAQQQAQRPFFVWLHYPDTHAPYRSVTEADSGLARYAGALAYVDAHFGRLVESVTTSGLADKTLIILSSDHGEGLGTRGREGHGPDLYEESIRVPLGIRIAGCAPARVEHPVSLTQLAATIAAFTNAPVSGSALAQSADSPATVVVEEEPVRPLTFSRAIVGDRYKLIVDARNGGRMLFDLETDPGETHNIASDNPEALSQLEASYQRWLDAPGAR